jgi:hypothetical protein
MITSYKNPWYEPGGKYGPPVYTCEKRPMITYRGVQIFKVWERRYDVVMNGVCITQRAGASNPRQLIDNILDGKDPFSERALEIARGAAQ